jgi:single-stranded-DNA-specific exonuclease
MTARWLVCKPEPDLCRTLAGELHLSPVLAQVLVNRGLTEPDAARAFLEPRLRDLADPALLPGIEAALDRLDAAARNKEKILVYGDYDVDGTAATALLVRFLRQAGLDADYYVPHRIDEGYGLNLGAIDEFKRRGTGLIITVDCGVGAVEECEHARRNGIDVIVTDHHEPGDHIAPACAVINPKLTGSLHPFRDLSGVGVAFKFAWAVADRFSPGDRMSKSFRRFLLDSLGLVALGTVADIVPLLGENRVLAKYGLIALTRSPSPGMRALMDCARLRGARVSSRDIAFGLGPRLNAAGRMANADLAIELMMTDDSGVGCEIAAKLERQNSERRKLQADIFEHAREEVVNQPGFESARSIVLAHETWHPGVVGIVASKLVDEFNRPTALIAVDGSGGRGSARSVPGFHMFNALDGFRDRMISFGGHAGAAGFEIATADIPDLREHLETVARQTDVELFQPSVEVDAEVAFGDLSPHLVQELEQLQPHGEANRRPLFVAHGLRVAGRPRLVGMAGKHVSFYVTDGRTSLRAIAFGLGEALYDRMLAGERDCSLVFSPRLDTWSGSGGLELRVKDVHFNGG